jgi:biopolymer transport protein ExbB
MNLGSLLLQAGWAMVPIYGCSILALSVFVQKLVQFRLARLEDMTWFAPVRELIAQDQRTQALERCARSNQPVARVVAATASTWWTRPERAEAEGRRVGSLELQNLESRFGLLSFIAQVAPLLGLLGTVLGMVDLFAGLGSAGIGNVDAAALSGGIWKALLTTAAGLIVAVPALAAHTWLTSKTDALRLRMSDAMQQVLTLIDIGPSALPIEPSPRSSDSPRAREPLREPGSMKDSMVGEGV